MKAIVCEKYGGPDVLELKEVPTPTPEDNEVLVKVFAVSVNDWDWALLHGVPYLLRLPFNLFKPPIKIFGSDIAGRVEAIGKNVEQFKPGDEVYGDLSNHWGGFAEYVCAKDNALALKPASMTFPQAAAIPQAAMLAVQGLIDKGNIQSGQKILINGAGGGVGTFGVQLAKLYGCEVTGVDNTGKLELMRSVGFDHVIDYTKEDFTKNGKRYDLILDQKTNRSVFDYPRLLTPGGKYITTGGSSFRILQVVLFGPLISKIYNKQVSLVMLKLNKDLAYMNELFESGKIKPVIDGPYSLNEVPKVFKIFGAGSHKGKLVITLTESVKQLSEKSKT